MKRSSFVAAAMSAALVTLAAIAQAGPPQPGQGRGSPGMRIYDPATVETVSGEVARVEHVAPAGARRGGVHLVIKKGDETVAVHLGPAWYIDHQDVKIAAGDHVEVKGSRVTVDGHPAIIAAEVKKGDHTLVLRDAAGVPKWSRRGRGRR